MTTELNIGDVLHASWGYDQTNNNFYQVVKKTEKSVWIKPINYEYRQAGFMCGYVKPVKDSFKDWDVFFNDRQIKDGKVCRISKYGGVKLSSFAYAYKVEDLNAEHYDSDYA